MLVWLIAILFVVSGVVSGYYKGAVRASFTFLGLVLGALLALSLSGLGSSLLSVAKVNHPVAQKLFGPLPVFFIICFIFIGLGMWVHHKVAFYYKYKVGSDDIRVRWEHMNQQVGLCIGAINGVISVILLCTGIYVLGYFTVQVSAQDRDPWWAGLVNSITRGLEETGFYRVTASVAPVDPIYYKGADVLGLLHTSPDLKNRLGRYPLLLSVSEEDRFQSLGNNKALADFWKGGPTISEWLANESIGPVLKDRNFYGRMMELLGEDLDDLKTFLETGQSPKYSEQRIVDRWNFNYPASYVLARKVKPNMTIAERQYLRSLYQTVWSGATMTALLDQEILLKNKTKDGLAQSLQGKWKHDYGGKYTVEIRDKGVWSEFEALVETNQLTLSQEGLVLVFDN